MPARAPRRWRGPWAVALVVVLGTALWLGRSRLGGVRLSGSGLNLLLVTLDTTRADRLGCYRHPAARPPRPHRPAPPPPDPPTPLPPTPSISPGLPPFEHGVRNNGNFSLPDRFPPLAPVLRERGYRTAAFVSSFILDRRYGLARGFETYDDRMSEGSAAEPGWEAERRGDLTAAVLVRWLESPAGGPGPGPFLARLHLDDPPGPYR